MIQTFHETVIDGVLVAPFLAYVVAAVVGSLLLRPLLRRVGFERVFSHPPVAQLSLFIIILASLIAIF